MVFKVLSSVVYCIMDNYICYGYLSLQQDIHYFANKGFEKQESIIFQ